MTIDPVSTLNMPGITSQNGLQANSGPVVGNQANSGPAVSNRANGQAKDNNKLSNQEQNPDNTNASSEPAPSGIVGGLALDDDNGVVVRFYDSTGKVVAQFPPEDYLEMMKQFNLVNKQLFHTTA